jgi:hypothetical protein
MKWLVHGEFTNPAQIIAVNLPANSCRDVSAEFAEAVRLRNGRRMARRTVRFVETNETA